MGNIYTNATLSCEIDGSIAEYKGSVQFETESFQFVSEKYQLTATAETIEYISYSDTVFLAIFGDATDYTISLQKDQIKDVQGEINGLFENWLFQKDTVEMIEGVYEKGIPLDVISRWIVWTRPMEYIRQLEKDKTEESTKKAKDILTILSKVEDKELVRELSTGIETIAEIFSVEYKKTSEIEKYVDDPEIKKCNDLHWLKKTFYALLMGSIKVGVLEEMIDESMREIISKIIPEISEKMTYSEIRKVFEELCDSKTLDIFVRHLAEQNILQRIEMLDEVDKVHILYHIAAQRKDIVYAYAVDNPKIIETVIERFLDAIERKEYDQLIPLEVIIEIFLSAENIALSIAISEYIQYLFENPGQKTIRTINGWPQASSTHRVSLYHLQILNHTIQDPPVYIKLYIITSGIIFSVIKKITDGTETEKYLASSFVLSMLTKKDRTIEKYIESIRVADTLRDTLQQREMAHTAYSPIISKISHILDLKDIKDQTADKK